MEIKRKSPVVLMVDDDGEDVYLTKRAFSSHIEGLSFGSVHSGSELFDYLYCRNKYSENVKSDFPDVILLDINIPKENGFAILEKLRQDERFGHIPICMLTTSSAPHDIDQAYKLGANAFLSKSVNAADMKSIAKTFCDYWFNSVLLPTL